jgi:hypothetical protein
MNMPTDKTGIVSEEPRIVHASDREYYVDKHGSLRVHRYADTSSGGKQLERSIKRDEREKA